MFAKVCHRISVNFNKFGICNRKGLVKIYEILSMAYSKNAFSLNELRFFLLCMKLRENGRGCSFQTLEKKRIISMSKKQSLIQEREFKFSSYSKKRRKNGKR
jgi:hypothetical protein